MSDCRCNVSTGALGCLLTCIALGVGQGLTLYTLSKFAERYDAHTYSVLVRVCFPIMHDDANIMQGSVHRPHLVNSSTY